MHVRPGRASGGTDRTQGLTTTNMVASFHIDPRQMEKGAVESHAVIDHQQIALQREGMVSRQHDHAIGGRDKDRASRLRDIDARMIGAGFAAIDALRAEQAA